MKRDAEVTGERRDCSLHGYSDIIQRKYPQAGDIWLKPDAEHT